MPPDLVTIDGAAGEGGGQVLRSSLALSMAMGVPFRITNIRANRDRPGLMRQHLTAVQAAASMCAARCDGAAVGSTELLFAPGDVRAGTHHFTIGTAGSTTLVLQAIVPALLFAESPSEILVEGGTHARWAPPYEFFERCLAPVLERTGARVQTTLVRHGFYPAGGGAIRVRVEPTRRPQAVTLHERGEILRRSVEVILAKIPFDVARRELEVLRAKLNWPTSPQDVRTVTDSIGPGNAVLLELASENVCELCCVLGEHGKRAEAVAAEAVDLVREYLVANVPVGFHLADQLMVPMAIAALRSGRTCGFTTMSLSRHARTNSDVVAAFLRRSPRITQLDERRVRWEVPGEAE